ncbi:MAG: prolipoprotein diacylglyceryl transferase [Rhodocyclaceae bacterium]|nr:prolipoprotein diacylglyceryl transferase [Rhodocyclaceae bacterium]MCO5097018.1 prolipoprotein diacylglyceryl transferase [Rhodocyclaceae bacterium]
MLTYPHIDPVAISLGPLSVRWYGLMYLAGFVAFVALGRWRISRRQDLKWTAKDIDDLLFYGVIGVVIGGRLGQVLFYEPGYYLSHPLEIFAVWKGGMAFHGGFLGVLVAMMLYARKRGLTWLAVMDFIAPLVPPGLGFGRIGNFINGELWGRAADPSLPWAMVFPHVDSIARHPSQLYQAFLEGIVFFGVLWWFSAKPRATGAVSGMFLVGYGVVRFVAEYFREPDAGIFGLSYTVSMGQWLSLPMVAAGVAMLLWSRRAR